MKRAQPSSLEMQVLSVLWENGPLSVREVSSRLPDGKSRAYTTVLSIMQAMEKKRLVRLHATVGNRHVYAAAAKRKTIMGSFFRSLVGNLFGGRPSTAMQQLLETTDVSDAELAEMQALLEEHRKKRRSR